MKSGSGLVGMLAVAALAGAASADVVISNLNIASASGTVFGNCATTVYKAGGFTMPTSGPNYELDLVQLYVNFDTSPPAEDLAVSVWSGAGAPSTLLTTTTMSGTSTGLGAFDFVPDSPVTLEAGQTYWVYVEPTIQSGCTRWEGDSGGAQPTGIATSAGYIFNGNSSAFANRYEVQGSPDTGCYADCDGSGALNIFDYICFGNEYAAGCP